MKKLLILLLSLVMVMTLFAGCGDGSGTVNDKGGTDVGTDDQVYKLSINYHGPSTNVVGEATLAAIAKAEEMSNGRLQFTPYWDGNYVSYDESIQSTINGVVDICYVDAGNLNEVFYLNQLLTMPYTCNLPSRLGAHEVMQQVLKEIPEINEELEAVGLTWLGLTNMGGMVIHFSKDVEVRTPNDIKGMILDAPANAGTLVQSLGATATAMVATEFYTS